MKNKDLYAELERIRISNGGRLTPEAVLDDAVDETSPLHPMFEWDDAKAAKEHRLWMARQLIKRVVISNSDYLEKIGAPGYVNVLIGDNRYYQATEIAVTSVDEWKSAVEQLTAKMEGIVKTLKLLEAFQSNASRQKRARVSRKSVERAVKVMAG